MRELLRFWFTFERTVTRPDYLRHGLGLMAVKYSVDALVIGIATGTFWSPLDYLQSVPLLLSTRLAEAPSYLPSVLALWTLPFLWIGISMTIRRLLDAGWSAWWSLLFFVPLASYVSMAVLSVAPSGIPCQRRLKMSQKWRLKMSHPPRGWDVSLGTRVPPCVYAGGWMVRRPGVVS